MKQGHGTVAECPCNWSGFNTVVTRCLSRCTVFMVRWCHLRSCFESVWGGISIQRYEDSVRFSASLVLRDARVFLSSTSKCQDHGRAAARSDLRDTLVHTSLRRWCQDRVRFEDPPRAPRAFRQRWWLWSPDLGFCDSCIAQILWRLSCLQIENKRHVASCDTLIIVARISSLGKSG